MDFCIRTAIFLFCLSGVHCIRPKLARFKTKSANVISDSTPVFLDSMQLITKYNYPAERHSVVTDDGYIVTLFRIPGKGPPVLLVHGIGDSSDSWLVLGPTGSLAYLLADAGFDVWIYNSRGNKYSKEHTRRVSRKQYWNFSFEEMGTKDLPATVDYILQRTSRSQLFYVGFSQGTTVLFVMCSVRPDHCAKIRFAVLLAPVAWVNYIRHPLINVLTQNLEHLSSLADHLGLYELFPNNHLLNLYHSEVCNSTSPLKLLCDTEFFFSYDLRNIKNLPSEMLPVIASHIPAGSSKKTFIHFMQGYLSKGFRRYDYFDSDKNFEAYGSEVAPEYNVSLTKVPLAMISSVVDSYSTPLDVEFLKSKLPYTAADVVLNKSLDFTHLEFVYGTRVRHLINEPVLKLLRELK